MNAREEVLARIRTALREVPPGSSMPREAPVVPGHRTSGDLTGAGLIGLLAARLADYGSAVRRCPPGQVPAAIGAALADRGVRRLVVPEGLDLGALPADVDVVVDDGMSADALDTFDGVITTATVAIAETGTIVLDGSPGQGRRALSLIPDYHLCLLRHDQVAGLVTEAIGMLSPHRPLTWISGPSATSDIELDRVQGVHGPRTLEVILIGA